MTRSTTARTAVLSIFLLAVIVSGIPQVEIHTHQDAYFGHDHGVNQHYDDHNSDNVFPDDVDGSGDSGTTHAHDLGVSAVTLISAGNVDIVVHRRSNSGIPPPGTRPPDNLTPPLYRPPIV
ncbi:MAG: hypothetical protein O3A13_13330 [Proteobacteria bacterium]|nr:hypothetical protein [Pseudomonadota bacterium]MDA0994595.1 hypothetical protein [Pseudomonadota bacterium]